MAGMRYNKNVLERVRSTLLKTHLKKDTPVFRRIFFVYFSFSLISTWGMPTSRKGSEVTRKPKRS